MASVSAICGKWPNLTMSLQNHSFVDDVLCLTVRGGGHPCGLHFLTAFCSGMSTSSVMGNKTSLSVTGTDFALCCAGVSTLHSAVNFFLSCLVFQCALLLSHLAAIATCVPGFIVGKSGSRAPRLRHIRSVVVLGRVSLPRSLACRSEQTMTAAIRDTRRGVGAEE